MIPTIKIHLLNATLSDLTVSEHHDFVITTFQSHDNVLTTVMRLEPDEALEYAAAIRKTANKIKKEMAK